MNKAKQGLVDETSPAILAIAECPIYGDITDQHY